MHERFNDSGLREIAKMYGFEVAERALIDFLKIGGYPACSIESPVIGRVLDAIITGVADGPAQEVVYRGDNLMEKGCLDEIPVPVSTPGFDNAPYLTAGNWITKDPDTGIMNVGNYRGMVKSRSRIGCMANPGQHIRVNFKKYKEKGKRMMPAAIGPQKTKIENGGCRSSPKKIA